MRLDIVSEDRIGITQEIIAVFAARQWNLIAMEMHLHHTFVHVADSNLSLAQLAKCFEHIEGVKDVRAVNLLPGESRRQHMDALLKKLPDPILDIDNEGQILVANHRAEALFKLTLAALSQHRITELIKQPLSVFLRADPALVEISFGNKHYLADITPVKINNVVTGAVIILRSPARIGQEIAMVSPSNRQAERILGKSAAIIELHTRVKRFANLDLPVLISGETGTGKELFAQAIHKQSHRAEESFLSINCSALPENLLESELFGYAAGAFTGASRGGKPGLVEMADGGTVFLDEVGEMSAYLQAKLLRFLQDYRFRRVGGAQEIQVNVRIVSATHRDLQQMVKDGTFREDLYYRINVLNVHLPALRERPEDIPVLAKHFVDIAARQVNQNRPKLSSAAMNLLCQQLWPGNVRQLQNLLFRSVAMCENSVLDCEDLQFGTLEQARQTIDDTMSQADLTWDSAQAVFEKQLLSKLLPLYPTTRSLADKLAVSHNKIAVKLREYGLNARRGRR